MTTPAVVRLPTQIVELHSGVTIDIQKVVDENRWEGSGIAEDDRSWFCATDNRLVAVEEGAPPIKKTVWTIVN